MTRRRWVLRSPAGVVSTSHATRSRCAAGANVAFVAAVVPLMGRMSAELGRTGELSRRTQVRMWAGYATFGLLALEALTHRSAVRAPRALRRGGWAVTVAGAALAVPGMGAFSSAAQLNGAETGELITGGVYDYSRNPQYAGFVVAVAGLALARSSPRAAVLAAIPSTWVRVEERHLQARFGSRYARLCQRVPRWIGFPAPVADVAR